MPDFYTRRINIEDATQWQPPSIHLGDWIENGASTFPNTGAGAYISFASNANDEILGTFALANNGIPYSEDDIALVIYYQLAGVTPSPPPVQTIKFEIDYALVKADGTENALTKTATVVIDEDVGTLVDGLLYSVTSPTIAGLADAKILNVTIRRLSQGGGSDSYSGTVDVYGVEIIKV